MHNISKIVNLAWSNLSGELQRRVDMAFLAVGAENVDHLNFSLAMGTVNRDCKRQLRSEAGGGVKV
jgi:hypothetical protein